jgi:hypothetical protein
VANQISFGGAVTSVARFILAGNFSMSVIYQPMSVVFDPSSGASYVALTTTVGNAVSNATYWAQMTAGGGVASVNGRGGVVTLSSSDLSDKDAASGVAGLDASGFLKVAEYNTTLNAQVGTSYTLLATDRGKLVTLNNAASVAVTVPAASGSFAAGFFCEITNLGAGVVTLTPTGTIDGAASITLKQFQSITLTSVGGNWISLRNIPGGTTGSGAVVLATSPTFVTSAITPALVLNGNTLNGVTGSGTAVVTNTSPTIIGTITATAIKQAAGASFNIADPLGQSHFFVSSSSPYTNTFVNGNGAGVVFLGSAAKTSVDDVTGQIVMSGATSGTVTLKASAVAGSGTLTFPAATDTLVGQSTTDTLERVS